MKTYNVDGSRKHVKLEVRVGTVGIGVTRVRLTENGSYEKLFDSEPGMNGSIPLTKIGENTTVNSEFLEVRLTLDLSNLGTVDLRKKAIQNLFMECELTGGPDGQKDYEVQESEIDTSLDPTKLRTVIVTQEIQFV